MLETFNRVAEGWYPDPSGRLLLRYWNGINWTLETRGNDAWAMNEESVALRAPSGQPEPGWAGVAFALHSALNSRFPVTVRITLPDRSVITVHSFDQVYTWPGETSELPALSRSLDIAFVPSDVGTPNEGRSLDGLLWRISHAAFPDRLAPWLQTDDLFRMQRWPNLTTINPELDDMRQAAMLANGMFTVDELAGFSDRSIAATRSLINALSLMNTLKVATPRDTIGGFAAQSSSPQVSAVAQTHERTAPSFESSGQSAAPARKPGLFQRLRAKLGL